MKKLMIVRHGIALPHGTPGFADDERPLTPKGERRVRQIAYGLKSLTIEVDRIVTSPLPRAYRTAEIIGRVLGRPDDLETADALRAGESATAIEMWLETRGEGSLMIVGHNPGLSDLVSLLLTRQVQVPICELRRGGIASLMRPEIGSRWELEWLVRPRLIRRMSDC